MEDRGFRRKLANTKTCGEEELGLEEGERERLEMGSSKQL